MPAYQVSLGMTNHIFGGSNGRGGLTQYLLGHIEDSSVNGYYLKNVKYNNLDIKSEPYFIYNDNVLTFR